LAKRGGRRRYRRTMTQLAAAASQVGDELIVAPVDRELRAIAELSKAVRTIQR
jgi:hypothetical protein